MLLAYVIIIKWFDYLINLRTDEAAVNSTNNVQIQFSTTTIFIFKCNCYHIVYQTPNPHRLHKSEPSNTCAWTIQVNPVFTWGDRLKIWYKRWQIQAWLYLKENQLIAECFQYEIVTDEVIPVFVRPGKFSVC